MTWPGMILTPHRPACPTCRAEIRSDRRERRVFGGMATECSDSWHDERPGT